MNLMLLGRSYNVYGGPWVYNIAAKFLSESLPDCGPGIQQIELTPFFRSTSPPRRTLEASYEKHHRLMASLPEVKFFRTKSRATIAYATSLADAEIMERPGWLSAEFFAKVYDEIAQTLHLLDAKVKPADQFDLAALHNAVGSLRSSLPQTDEALRDLAEMLKQKQKARVAAMDPWERLDIDWSRFHPKARELLDCPFFWEEANDLAPHGNDTGSDVFAEYRKWTRRHVGRPAHELAEAVIKAWELPAIDWNEAAEEKVKVWLATDGPDVRVCDEAMLATAFGMIKLHGWCDPDTRSLALKAIDRERLPCLLAGWRDPKERQRGLALMEQCLLRILVQPPEDMKP